MIETISVTLLAIAVTNMVTFHISKFKYRKRERCLVDVNFNNITIRLNAIVQAMAECNGVGERFKIEYSKQLAERANELKVIKE